MNTELDQVDRFLASQVGLRPEDVHLLRMEFRKFGRNPLDSTLEILAIENGFEEEQVKTLFQLHLALVRRGDGLTADQRSVHDY